jgi:glyoxylase-like metal-dependent hydrolase (beta-lactamase superfamily II)
MFVQIFPSGPLSTNAYVAACAITKAAVIIDPAFDSAEPIYAYLKEHNLICQSILLTHSHWDHIANVFQIKKALNIPVYVHSLDALNLENPGADQLPCPLSISGVKADFFYDDRSPLPVGNLNFQIIHTPGHSAGSVCLFEPNHHILFSGDTLFKGTIGHISFPTSQPHLMWDSLRKLAELPPMTKVYPGHGPSTTIGKESWLADAQRYFG